MKSKIFIDEKEFELIIEYKKIKNINIRVKGDSILYISCPYNVRYKTIEDVIYKNKNWIIKNTLKMKKENNEENKLLYLGKAYSRSISISTFNRIDILEEKIKIYSKKLDKEFIDNLIKEWYYSEANKVLFEEVKSISQKLNLYTSKVSIGNQKTLWGSCNSKKHIRLNWRLILMPKSIREYIIIHELCHIVHMNHSKEFWDLVNTYDSNYKNNKLWLKSNGKKLINIY